MMPALKKSTIAITRRRSSRSISAPLTSEKSSQGSCCAKVSPATSAESLVRLAASSGPATSVTPPPRFEIVLAAHSLPYSRFTVNSKLVLLAVALMGSFCLASARAQRDAPKLNLPHALLTCRPPMEPNLASRRGLEMYHWRRFLFKARTEHGSSTRWPAAKGPEIGRASCRERV